MNLYKIQSYEGCNNNNNEWRQTNYYENDIEMGAGK